MNMPALKEYILEFQENDASNRITADIAKKPEYVGRKIHEGVICGVAAAGDPVISSLKAGRGANIDMMQPEEWLPGSKSVISFFMPIARWITDENAGGNWPSDAWLHGRIEGQASSDKAVSALADKLRREEHEVVIPTHDPRLKIFMKFAGYPKSLYTANWSERHVAFAAGLGTFGLSRGIITELGMAGRFMSIVTTLAIEPTPRPYSDLLEYCSKCGACIRACPSGAISLEHLKNHDICDAYLVKIRQKEEPYYGCGKCQCGMPCSFGIPDME
jgi:epoxyqueuosine reductase QueG